MELTIKIDQNKKEAKALLDYLRSLPYVDISRNSQVEKGVPKTKASDFVKKWKGFLKDGDTDKVRYNYLLKM